MNGAAHQERSGFVKPEIDAFADRLLAGFVRHLRVVDVQMMRHAIVVHNANDSARRDRHVVWSEMAIVLADHDDFGRQHDGRRDGQRQKKPSCSGQARQPIVRLFRTAA
jgi:hypothetical protein